MELENSYEEEKDEFDVECIDLFSLRVLSLLVCRGKSSEKASFLANLANEANHESISWDNMRLTRALKLMVYFSSILPSKFMSKNKNTMVYQMILNPNPVSQKRNNRFFND